MYVYAYVKYPKYLKYIQRPHFVHHCHIDINSFLPKIEELRYTAKSRKEVSIQVSEPKPHNFVLELDIQMDNSNMLFYDRIINGGMVACQIRNGLSYGIKSNIPHEIKSIFFELLSPTKNPITMAVMYRPTYHVKN